MAEKDYKIGGGFAFLAGSSFAAHKADEDQAFETLSLMRKDGLSWADAQSLFNQHINGYEWTADEKRRQMERVRRRFRPWLV